MVAGLITVLCAILLLAIIFWKYIGGWLLMGHIFSWEAETTVTVIIVCLILTPILNGILKLLIYMSDKNENTNKTIELGKLPAESVENSDKN